MAQDTEEPDRDERRGWFQHPETGAVASTFDAQASKFLNELIAAARSSTDAVVRDKLARYETALVCAATMRPSKGGKR